MKKIITVLFLFILSVSVISCSETETTTEEIDYWKYMETTEEMETIVLMDANQEYQEVYLTRCYEINDTETLYYAPSYMYNNGAQRWNHCFYGYILIESIRHLKSCFEVLFKNKIVKDNIFNNIDNVSEPHNKKYVPTTTELEQFLNYLRIAYYEIYLFAKFISLTGLRKGEALALTWSDIKDDRIFITKAWEVTADKIQKPKTKSSVRRIPLFPEVFDLLKTIEHTNDEIFSFIYKKSVGNRFKHHVDKFGIKNLTFHGLRHYFATQCMEAGIEDKVVTQWLGHSKYAITIDTYSYVQTDFENNEIEKMAKYRSNKR